MFIRRRLIALVLAVAASVLTGVVVTPVVVCQMGAEERAVATVVCTCGHGANAQCAMHKHHGAGSGAPAPASGNRWCAGCEDGAGMIMTALIGFAAPIADRSDLAPPDRRSAQAPAFAELPLDLVRPPISPPPRS